MHVSTAFLVYMLAVVFALGVGVGLCLSGLLFSPRPTRRGAGDRYANGLRVYRGDKS